MKNSNKMKKVSFKEVIKNNTPLTDEEANLIMKRVDTFFKKMRKDFGGDRYDIHTSTIISVVSPSGILTNLRGNMHTAQYAISSAVNVLIESVCDKMKLARENVLLYCITDIAEEVRKIWAEQPSPNNNDIPDNKITIEKVD